MKRFLKSRDPAALVTESAAMVVVIVLGAALVAGSQVLPEPVYEPVGPAAFPFWAGIALIILAIAAFGEALAAGTRPLPDAPQEQMPAPPLRERKDLAFLTIAVTALYGLAMDAAGLSFPVATSLFSFSLIVLLAGRKPKTLFLAALVALILGFGLQAVFMQIFYIDLPS